jgi:hypothetical protein
MNEAKKAVQDAVFTDLLQEHPLPKVKSGLKAGQSGTRLPWAPYGKVKPVPACLRSWL